MPKTSNVLFEARAHFETGRQDCDSRLLLPRVISLPI